MAPQVVFKNYLIDVILKSFLQPTYSTHLTTRKLFELPIYAH